MINKHFTRFLLESTNSREIIYIDNVQSLWSGYGEILRCQLDSPIYSSVIVKHVRFPDKRDHPRGWNSDLSHKRKVKSYQIEINWYKNYSHQCTNECMVPKLINFESHKNEIFMILEDLDAQGYNLRKTRVNLDEMFACLNWLANFHAQFLGQKPADLWKSGTYWHLDTRPDELKVLSDSNLKKAAAKIDLKLKQSPFQTFVHGDAKLANFCFSQHSFNVAAVDFQYIGGGCGMKDVAYFIGSCLNDKECEQYEKILLDNYFSELTQSVNNIHPAINSKHLEQNWRELYPVAWADFHRFVKGWSPGHWKIHSYSEEITRQVISKL